MSTMPQPPPVTNDELIKHRLKELEDFAVGARETGHRVDTLGLSLAAIEKTVTQIQSHLEARDRDHASGFARLHERLDEALREQAHEEGREVGRAEARAEIEAQAVERGRQVGLAEARRTNWKVLAIASPIVIATLVGVVALLNLILN